MLIWPGYESPAHLRTLERTALDIMLDDAARGLGETGANNRGDHIDDITLGHQGAKWCAAEVVDCYVRAAALLGLTLPFRSDWLPGSPRRGARALIGAVARVGAFCDEPHRGAVFGIKRRGDRLAGHAGLVVEVSGDDPLVCTTVEGNVGRFPAKVRVMLRDFNRERPCWGRRAMFASVAA